MERIAILGTGIMGGGMARTLLRAGYPVTVYNRTRERAEPLAEAGARVAETPREAAADAEVIVGMVSDDSASQAIWLGPEGALAGARAGSVLIESSTLSTGWVGELAGLAAEKGCLFLDAPVTGSRVPAETGQLVFFVGGESATLERVRPILDVMGRRIFHMGPTGSGATMKLINNLMAGVHVVALAEGLILAEEAGLDLPQVVEALLDGAPASPVVKGKAEPIAARDYETHFALRWMHKDMSYALDEAARRTVSLPLVALAREIYRLAMSRGLADADFSAVAEVLRPATGDGLTPARPPR